MVLTAQHPLASCLAANGAFSASEELPSPGAANGAQSADEDLDDELHGFEEVNLLEGLASGK
jgi:hypothetical protein